MKIATCSWLIGVSVAIAGCTPARLPEEESGDREIRVQGLIESGVLAMRKGDPESLAQARAAFLLADELLECDPRTKDALGSVAWREGDLDYAREMFKTAVQCDPEYSPGYMHLATIAEREGNREIAERLMEKSLQIAPLNGRARNNMFALYWAEGAAGSARVELRKAFEVMGTREPVLNYNADKVNQLSGRPSSAMER